MLCCLVVLLFIFWRAAPSLIPYEGKTLALQEFALSGEIHTGQLGPNICYEFNIDSGVMVISGSGITYLAREYIPVGFSPQERHDSTFDVGGREHFYPEDWEDYLSSPVTQEASQYPLSKVIVTEGVTGIDSGLFRDCSGLLEVYFPGSLDYLGFYIGCNLENVTFYFESDPPDLTRNKETGWEYGVIGNSRHITFVHRPGTFGWNSGIWAAYDDPEYGYTGYDVTTRFYFNDLFS